MHPRVIVALAAGLGFYTLTDVLIWQRIFEANSLYQYADQYHLGYLASLTGMVAVGMAMLYDLRWWALWFGAAFYLLAFSGLEDVLYYWLQLKAIPSEMPWLDSNPLILHPAGGWALVASVGFWLIVVALSGRVLGRITHRSTTTWQTTS